MADDDLSPEVRAFLQRLRPDEVAALDETIRLMLALYRVGRLGRWAVLGLLVVILTVGDVIEQLQRLWSWLGR